MSPTNKRKINPPYVSDRTGLNPSSVLSLLMLVLFVVVLVSLFIVGKIASSQANEADVVRPIEVIQPPDRQACTVELEATDEDQPANQATVSCGGQETTLAGDFREQTTNRYNPDTSNGITSIVIVGDESRVYMTYGEDETCAIIFSEGDDPTACEPTTDQEHTAS